MSDNQSCEERIAGQLAGRLEDMDAIMAAIDSEEPSQEFVDEYGDDPWATHSEYPLAIEEVRQVRIVLGTGGPHDEFLVTLDSEGDIVRISYVFQDWFDGATRELEGDEFDRASRFLAPYVEQWA